MTTTGLEIFDKTLQTTNVWLGEVEDEFDLDRRRTWHAVGAVLRALRDRLPIDLAAHLGAELPMLMRGAYYDQFVPSRLPDKTRTLDEFLERVDEGLDGIRPIDAEQAVRVTFRLLTHHLDPNQMRKVRDALPEEVRVLCPDPDVKH